MNKNLLVFGLALVMTGCATTDRDWHEASRSGTIEDYEKFMQTHPKADQVVEAKNRMQELMSADDFAKARFANTTAAYLDYLTKHAQSKYSAQAKALLELLESDADWQNINAVRTISAYKEFIQKHPNAKQSLEAKTELNRLEAARDWESAQKANSIPILEAFLKEYPTSQYYTEASRSLMILIAEKAWTIAESIGTESAWVDFIMNYPDSPRCDDAAAKLKNHQVLRRGGVIPWAALGGMAWTQEFREGQVRSRGIWMYGAKWGGLEDGNQTLHAKNMTVMCDEQMTFSCTKYSELKSFAPAYLSEVRFNGYLVGSQDGFLVQYGIAVIPIKQ